MEIAFYCLWGILILLFAGFVVFVINDLRKNDK